MIKAKELFFIMVSRPSAIPYGTMVYFYRSDYDVSGYYEIEFNGSRCFADHICFDTRRRVKTCKTLEEAKAACQAHYQQVVESMVDMGRLKRAIKNALINGNYFVDGPNEEDRADFFLEEIEKEFKNLEKKKE